MEVDAQGINVKDFEDLICHKCKNSPLTYYCPQCDYKVCLDCLPKCFRKLPSGALVCRQCGFRDKQLTTYVGYGKV
jgi:hypothetical protein